jgi:hypothetical protein
MARRFEAPYPFTFDTSSRAGSPTVVERGRNDLGTRDIYLQSHRTNPSSASIISAFGMDAGPPVDDRGRAITGRSELHIDASFDYLNTFFYAGAVYNNVLTEATANLYVEEFDPSGNFVRGIERSELVILRQGGFWISYSDEWAPRLSEAVFVTPISMRTFTQNRFQYRVWVDLRSQIRAAGWGFGGSGAIAQATLRLRSVTTWFDAA